MKRADAVANSGMTLVELMVALMVLSLGLVAILNALPTIYRAAARAQSMTISSLLAGEALARTKAEAAFPPVSYPGGGNFSDFGADFTFFGWRRDVSAALGLGFSLSGATISAPDVVSLVKFTVRYPFLGEYKDLKFYTYIADFGTM